VVDRRRGIVADKGEGGGEGVCREKAPTHRFYSQRLARNAEKMGERREGVKKIARRSGGMH
jgi:hypothetical protein